MKGRNRILILCFSDLGKDVRVHRQLHFLTERYEVLTAGFAPPFMEGIPFIRIEQPPPRTLSQRIRAAWLLKRGRFFEFYWSGASVRSALEKLGDKPVDLVLANDVDTLPVAAEIARRSGAKLLLDAHEYTPRDFDNQWAFRYFFQEYWDWVCRAHLHKADATLTVCRSIADEYRKNYDIHPEIITNAPFYEELSPSPSGPAHIRMIHHGSLNPTRRIENMIELTDLLDDRFHLDLMLMDNRSPYYRKLCRLAEKRSRVRILPPVPMLQVPEYINRYDVGLYMLPPAAFNNRMALPNKIFEFIQGRLALAIWPSPEMASVVKEWKLGVVSEAFTRRSMAEAMKSLTQERIMTHKWKAHRAASYLCAERNRDILVNRIEGLLGGPRS